MTSGDKVAQPSCSKQSQIENRAGCPGLCPADTMNMSQEGTLHDLPG